MKILFTLMLTSFILFAGAQQTLDHDNGSPLTMTCMFVILLISVLIAGVVYLLVNKNKRRGINENINSGTDK